MSDRHINNPDIPAEAVVRQLIEENKRLKEELGYYKTQANNQANAIKSFKKWQRNVTERTIEQWLKEAVNLDEPLLSRDTYERIKAFVGAVSQAKQALLRHKAVFKALERITMDNEIRELLKEDKL